MYIRTKNKYAHYTVSINAIKRERKCTEQNKIAIGFWLRVIVTTQYTCTRLRCGNVIEFDYGFIGWANGIVDTLPLLLSSVWLFPNILCGRYAYFYYKNVRIIRIYVVCTTNEVALGRIVWKSDRGYFSRALKIAGLVE